MKEKKVIDIKNLGRIGILIVFVLVAYIHLSGVTRDQAREIKLTKEEQTLISETPLADNIYWYSLDKFPIYKVEAARKVEMLIDHGMDQEEACQTVIEEVSDKVYSDTVTFMKANTDLSEFSNEEWNDKYYEYIYQTQKR